MCDKGSDGLMLSSWRGKGINRVHVNVNAMGKVNVLRSTCRNREAGSRV